MNNYIQYGTIILANAQQYLRTSQLLNLHFHLACIATCFRYSPLRDCGNFLIDGV